MKYIIKRQVNAVTEAEVIYLWSEIEDNYKKALDKLAKEIEIKGFRKGKAPLKLIEKQIDKNKIYEQVIKDIIPSSYTKILAENNLNPIITPKIELIKAKENEDWKVKMLIFEKPKVDLGNYKKIVSETRLKDKLWIPGKSIKEDKKDEDKTKKLDIILKELLKEIKIDLASELVEDEVNKMLSKLVDQTQKIGLTIEQYLQSKEQTSQQLRQAYQQQAEESLKLEFILEEIAEEEKIVVDQKDIDIFLNKISNKEEKEKLMHQSYFVARFLRRQKTLDRLLNL